MRSLGRKIILDTRVPFEGLFRREKLESSRRDVELHLDWEKLLFPPVESVLANENIYGVNMSRFAGEEVAYVQHTANAVLAKIFQRNDRRLRGADEFALVHSTIFEKSRVITRWLELKASDIFLRVFEEYVAHLEHTTIVRLLVGEAPSMNENAAARDTQHANTWTWSFLVLSTIQRDVQKRWLGTRRTFQAFLFLLRGAMFVEIAITGCAFLQLVLPESCPANTVHRPMVNGGWVAVVCKT